MKNNICLLVAMIWLTASLVLLQQTAFAGDPGCQNGFISNPYNNNNPPRRSAREAREQRLLAAAQARNGRNQPPPNGVTSSGGDSSARANFSYFSSLLLVFGGLWALFVLLRQRFGGRREPNRAATRGAIRSFVFRPSFALSMFGGLFAAAIVGGWLTAPTAVTAEKRDELNKLPMIGVDNPSNEPVFKAAQQLGGDGITQIGAPVFDAAGNRYVRGGFTENLRVGATTLQSSRYFDLFVAKYAPDGAPLWVRRGTGAGGALNPALAVEGATALAVDQSGNVYVGGSFVKTVTLEGGANQNVTLADDGAAGVNYESFVAKYDAGGTLLWARGGNTGSPKKTDDLEAGQNAVSQIVIDAAGNPYVAGSVSGSRFLDATFTNSGETDILLARLNPATGAIVWRQIIGGAKDDAAYDLDIDGSGNLYLIGTFGSPSIVFPTNPATTFTKASSEEIASDSFIAKFDAGGGNLWVKSLRNERTVSASQIAVSGAGEIYLTGSFFDSVTFNTAQGAVTLTETERDNFFPSEKAQNEPDKYEAGIGGYVAKLNQNGETLWAKGFGGVGKTVAFNPANNKVYIAGTFWDDGAFGADTPNKEVLQSLGGEFSFGGEDLFVARYDAGGNFEWAKPITALGTEGQTAVLKPSDTPNSFPKPTENGYNPLGVSYNPASGTMFVSGDFSGAVALDCLTLVTANDGNRQSYIAELSGDAETVGCRVWNGLDADDNNFDSPDNWNGGVLPQAGDSVFVPYIGNNSDAPVFNPATNIALKNLTVADERVLTLQKNLTVNGRLDLFGGTVDSKTFSVALGASAQTFSVKGGVVFGTVQKQFAAGSAGAFTFPVGTADGAGFPQYTPVTLSNITGAGVFSVTANAGAYPNPATGLPVNRAARWWNLTNGGLTKADLTFRYSFTDITQGTESDYRAYRIPTGGGAATLVNSSIDINTLTVSAPNVTQFSDWTLAQPAAPTAAAAAVGGRVTTADGRGIAGARVTMIDQTGNSRAARTNAFGFYRFADVATGADYVFSASHKRFQFERATQIQSVTGDRDDVNFYAVR